MTQKFQEIISGEQLVLVDFFATWCGPCKSMHPVLEQVKEQFGDSIRILKLDVEKNQAISSVYRVQAVPTLILFRNGNVVWRQSGAMDVNNLSAVIREYL